jgi:DNA-directed RNA polymerase specialized sigma24 family protein
MLNRRQEARLVSLVYSGEYNTAEVAELFDVGRSTVHRAIERQRVAAKTGLAEPNRHADVPGRRLFRIRHPNGTPAP